MGACEGGEPQQEGGCGSLPPPPVLLPRHQLLEPRHAERHGRDVGHGGAGHSEDCGRDAHEQACASRPGRRDTEPERERHGADDGDPEPEELDEVRHLLGVTGEDGRHEEPGHHRAGGDDRRDPLRPQVPRHLERGGVERVGDGVTRLEEEDRVVDGEGLAQEREQERRRQQERRRRAPEDLSRRDGSRDRHGRASNRPRARTSLGSRGDTRSPSSMTCRASAGRPARQSAAPSQ